MPPNALLRCRLRPASRSDGNTGYAAEVVRHWLGLPDTMVSSARHDRVRRERRRRRVPPCDWCRSPTMAARARAQPRRGAADHGSTAYRSRGSWAKRCREQSLNPSHSGRPGSAGYLSRLHRRSVRACDQACRASGAGQRVPASALLLSGGQMQRAVPWQRGHRGGQRRHAPAPARRVVGPRHCKPRSRRAAISVRFRNSIGSKPMESAGRYSLDLFACTAARE